MVFGGMSADGNLSDWGLVVQGSDGVVVNQGTTLGDPSSGSSSFNDLSFSFIYETGTKPGGGRQNYDTRFFGVGVSGNQLAIAIVTGQRPDNGGYKYSPGDIYLSTGAGTFGLEVGGGYGGNSNPGTAITYASDANGSTYHLNGSGYTLTDGTGHTSGTEYKAGRLVEDAAWIAGAPYNQFPNVQIDHGVTGKTILGDSSSIKFHHGRNEPSGKQYTVIEALIDLDLLGLSQGGAVTASWSPSCGNDPLGSGITFTTDTPPVPEPASMALFAFGSIGCGFLTRRRRKTQLAA